MPVPLRFPQDELSHHALIEWWYFNGNVTDDAGNEYAFMYCLFRTDPRKINLPFLSKIPLSDLYFSHFVLSDAHAQKMESGTELFYSNPPQDASRTLLHLSSPDDFSLEEYAPFSYRLKTAQVDFDLVSWKQPLLVNETGWVAVKSGGAYYYSLTDLDAKGSLTLGGKKLSVRGKAWMDHQWSDEPASSEDKWNWFSLQLESGDEILCCEYGDRKKVKFATISRTDGSQATTHAVTIRPADKVWRSSKTGAAYPTRWEIELPEWHMRFETNAKVSEGEVIFGAINYWEGGIRVSGTANGAAVAGNGFMEIVGIPMSESALIVYAKEAEALVSEYLHRYL
ncbi:MAG: hypothetical protein KGI60_01765 [Patescibacteria group bacterium]|nr:hypothetical protein [Patescibacteria group bacterium]